MKLNNYFGNKFSDENLIGLDLFRFILSLIILIVHFPQFTQSFQSIENFDKSQLPFFYFLSKIYINGGFAVQLFWMLSGVIFSHFYYNKIENLSFKIFFYLRITRLYPIHILTLLIVLISQLLYYKNIGEFFLINNNDIFHFILNIFLINYWNPDFQLSFNAPFWSVSVEIFTYIVFFILVSSRLFRKDKHLFILVLILLIFTSLKILSPFNECLLYFFIGVLFVRKYKEITFSKLIILLFLMATLLIIKKNNILKDSYIVSLITMLLSLSFAIVSIFLFSIKIQNLNIAIKKLIRKLSNLTYSMYMIHFSIQLILLLFFRNKGLAFFNNNHFFMSYIAINILVSYILYSYYEFPFQNFLRKKLIG
jgi:peptidoglycan/LPS O-acetylase OafA/YrhL